MIHAVAIIFPFILKNGEVIDEQPPRWRLSKSDWDNLRMYIKGNKLKIT